MDNYGKNLYECINGMYNIILRENNDFKNKYNINNKTNDLLQKIFNLLLDGFNKKKIEEKEIDDLLYELLENLENHLEKCKCIIKCNENTYLQMTNLLKISNRLKNDLKMYILIK